MVDFYRIDALTGRSPFQGFGAIAIESELRRRVHEPLASIDPETATHHVGFAHPSECAALAQLKPITVPYTFDGAGVERWRGMLIRPADGLAAVRDSMVRREHLMTRDAKGRPTAVMTASLPHLLWQPPELHKLFPEHEANLKRIFESGRFMAIGSVAVHPEATRFGCGGKLCEFAKREYKVPLMLQVVMARPEEMHASRPPSLNTGAIALFQRAGFRFGGWTSTFTNVPGFSPDHPEAKHCGLEERFLAGVFYLMPGQRPPAFEAPEAMMKKVLAHPWTEADRNRRYHRAEPWFPAGRPGSPFRRAPFEVRRREQMRLNRNRGGPWVSRRAPAQMFDHDCYEGSH